MIKRVLLIVALSSIAVSLPAAELLIYGGTATGNYMGSDLIVLEASYGASATAFVGANRKISSSVVPGYSAGLGLNLPLFSRLHIQLEGGYVNIGHRILIEGHPGQLDSDNISGYTITYTETVHLIETGALLRLKVFKKLHFSAGLINMYRLPAAVITFVGPDGIKDPELIPEDDLLKTSFGITGGLTIQLIPTIEIDVRYVHQILSLSHLEPPFKNDILRDYLKLSLVFRPWESDGSE